MKGRKVKLLEHVGCGTTTRVDREAGVIHGVKVIGRQSGNGREYLREALASAANLYERRGVFVDHPSKQGAQRSCRDKLGWLENVRPDANGELYGDLHVLKSHPMAGPTFEVAERAPDQLGLSHNAHGREQRGSGGRIIESVDRVHSVDLVTDPATVRGLFESQEPTVKVTWRKLIEGLAKKHPKRSKLLREMMDSSGADMDDPMMGDQADAGDDQGGTPGGSRCMGASGDIDPDEAVKSGLRSGVMGILDDDSLDVKAKVAKIKQFLQAEEDLIGKGGGEGDTGAGDTTATPSDATDSTDDTTTDTTEGRRPRKLAPGEVALREELAVRDLVEEAGLRFAKPEHRKAFVRSLVPLNKAERKALIEERTAAGGQQRAPRSQPAGRGSPVPLQEGKQPSGAEDFARSLFS